MMNSFVRKAAVLLLSGVMGASLLAGCGSTKIDGSKTVVTVGEEEVQLGVVSFYTKYQQAMMYKYYGAMLGTTGMFDTSMAATSSNDGTTYGEQMRNSALEDVVKMVVIRQHAADYDVALTEEEEQKIAETAQAYIDGNSEEVRNEVGASLENVKELLRLQTIQSKMLDPIAADVDTNVSQEEAQQSKITYIAVKKDDSTASEADSTAEAADDGSAALQEKAQQLLAAIQAEADIANADLNAIAQSVDSTLSAVTGHYTTSNTTDGSVDSAIVEAVQGLGDGTLVDHVITGSDGSTLYVARFDLADDAESTETTRASIIRTRKQDRYNEVTDGWVNETERKIDKNVLKTLVLSDKSPMTLADPVTESTVEEAGAESTAS